MGRHTTHTRALALGACALLVVGCAAGNTLDDAGGGGGMDVGPGDAGAREDAGPIVVDDDGGPPPVDANLETNGDTCDPCAAMLDCMPGLNCVSLTSGGMACLPGCDPDLPDCPPRFDCVTDFGGTLPEPTCAPVGERCCVDPDGDLHGSGVGCLGTDCDENDMVTNSSATEICDGNDNDCDGAIDEGDANALCPRGEHVATSRCNEVGACENVACEPGFGDCDDDTTNGCEEQTNTLMHCGGCFMACDPANATGDCSSGTCGIAACDAGFGDCNNNPSDGCETPLDSVTHCGGCGVPCAPASAIGDCSSGTCQIGTCNPRRADCDNEVGNGCETPTTTNADCGGCNIQCVPANAIGECSTGTCRLVNCTRSDYDDCDGIATNGCERNLRTNTDCNACDAMCSIAGGSASCASGVCTPTGCAMGLGDCDSVPGCEQMLNTNTHCGGCNVGCNPMNGTGSCGSGTCVITGCSPGWDDCDGDPLNGCETRLNTLEDCGACNSGCALANASETCASGQCRIDECENGYGQCDSSQSNGCERNLRTNSNCGGCNVSCSIANSTETCGSGVCTWTGCNSGYSSCDGTTSNGCELNHDATSSACGSGSSAGTHSGDRECGFGCGSNTGWDLNSTFTGNTDRWFRGRVSEASTCSASIEHRVRLEVPPGIDYDLRVYRNCSAGPVAQSNTRTSGADETVTFGEGDSFGSDDDFDYFVHVVYVSGATCANYTIRFDGHDC